MQSRKARTITVRAFPLTGHEDNDTIDRVVSVLRLSSLRDEVVYLVDCCVGQVQPCQVDFDALVFSDEVDRVRGRNQDRKSSSNSVEPGNSWAGFALYYEAIADRVEPEMIKRWGTKLAGVDVFTKENVTTIAVSLLLDAPRDPR